MCVKSKKSFVAPVHYMMPCNMTRHVIELKSASHNRRMRPKINGAYFLLMKYFILFWYFEFLIDEVSSLVLFFGVGRS